MTVRQSIVDALVTRLKTVTVSNGYASNAGLTVYAWFPENLQVNVLPCILIRDTADQIEDLSRTVTQHRLSIDVMGFVASGTTTDDAARALVGDLAKCLMNPADRTLGGVCDSISMTDGGTIQLEQSSDATRASVSLGLTVVYRTERGDWSQQIT